MHTSANPFHPCHHPHFSLMFNTHLFTSKCSFNRTQNYCLRFLSSHLINPHPFCCSFTFIVYYNFQHRHKLWYRECNQMILRLHKLQFIQFSMHCRLMLFILLFFAVVSSWKIAIYSDNGKPQSISLLFSFRPRSRVDLTNRILHIIQQVYIEWRKWLKVYGWVLMKALFMDRTVRSFKVQVFWGLGALSSGLYEPSSNRK